MPHPGQYRLWKCGELLDFPECDVQPQHRCCRILRNLPSGTICRCGVDQSVNSHSAVIGKCMRCMPYQCNYQPAHGIPSQPDIPECGLSQNFPGKSADRFVFELPFRNLCISKRPVRKQCDNKPCRYDGGLRDMPHRSEYGILYNVPWCRIYSFTRNLRVLATCTATHADLRVVPQRFHGYRKEYRPSGHGSGLHELPHYDCSTGVSELYAIRDTGGCHT